MSANQAVSYENDPNYQAFLAEGTPPWRAELSAVRPEIVPQTLTPDERREAIEQNLGIVQHETRLLMAAGVLLDPEEALQDGAEGLCDAAIRYDASKGAKFTTYAPHRVRGAIVDGVRKYDKLAGKKRTSARVVSQLNSTRALSLFQAAATLSHGGVSTIEDVIPLDQPSVEAMADSRAEVSLLYDAIEGLAPRQREVILQRLKYLSRKAIAASLGVSIRTVDRDIQKARQALRTTLQPQLFDDI